MPAFVVMMEVDGARDARFGLVSRHIGGNKVAPADRRRVGQSEQTRQDRRRGVATERIAAIIEVERMRGGAVHQGCMEHRQASLGPKDQGRAGGPGHAQCDPCTGLARPRKRDSHGVENAYFRPFHRDRRQAIIGEGADAPCKLGGDRHAATPRAGSLGRQTSDELREAGQPRAALARRWRPRKAYRNGRQTPWGAG